jgi:hypothetical protein
LLKSQWSGSCHAKTTCVTEQSQVQLKERREHPVILYSIHFVGQVGDNWERGLQVWAVFQIGSQNLKSQISNNANLPHHENK